MGPLAKWFPLDSRRARPQTFVWYEKWFPLRPWVVPQPPHTRLMRRGIVERIPRRRSEMHRMPRALAILVLTLLAGVSLPAATAHARVFVYNAVISAKQETPVNATTGSGGGYFVIDTDANTVNFWISFAGLSSPENAAHIHGFAGPGTPAGVVFGLPAGNPKVGTWNYVEGQEASILAGLCYVNIHTNNNP